MLVSVHEHVGVRLRRQRRTLGLTQRQLGLTVGITFQQIQKYECGDNRIDVGKLWLLAVALDTPIEYFFEGLPRKVNDCAGKAPQTDTQPAVC